MGSWHFGKIDGVGGHEMECYCDEMSVVMSERSFVIVVVVVMCKVVRPLALVM